MNAALPWRSDAVFLVFWPSRRMASRRCATAASHDIVLRQIVHIFEGLPVERWFPGLTVDHS
jgi:hypothetical protein